MLLYTIYQLHQSLARDRAIGAGNPATAQERMRTMTTNGARLFGFVVTGIVVIGGDHCPCALRLGRSGERTFAFEEWRLPNQIRSDGAEAPLRMSGPGAMPIDGVLRSVPAMLTGVPATGDLEYSLLGVATKSALERTAFVAEVRLRAAADEPSDIQVRLAPETARPFGFAWNRDCTIDRWLRELERASRRCPSFAGCRR
jgi:hypothetical protein